MPQLNRDILARTLLLLGFLILLFSLITTNQLTLYVHPRGTNAIKISGYVLFIMFLMQCWKLKKTWNQPWESHSDRKYWKYAPFALALTLAFLLPNSALNGSLVTNKGLNSQIPTQIPKGEYRPLAEELRQTSFIKVSDQNFIGVMSELYHYPKEYVGKEIEMKGFVYKDSSMASDRFSLVRYVVGCCVGDASPYGILFASEDDGKYIEGGWYQIQGIIENNEQQGKGFPVIHIRWSKKMDGSRVPYVFP